MTWTQSKYAFYSGFFLLLILLIWAAKDAGISGDEYLHYNHSLFVYDFFSSFGQDTRALNTPVTHLQYYGQSFDNATTILIKWLKIDQIFLFRHICCALCAALIALYTAKLAMWISGGYLTATISILLFCLSPTLMGHAQNNLKDIPFALGYIASIYYMILYIDQPAPKKGWILPLKLAISMAFAISVRPGGLLMICYFGMLLVLSEASMWCTTRKLDINYWYRLGLQSAFIVIIALLLSTLLWPYALMNPLSHIWESFKVMTQFPTTVMQLFNGKMEWSDWMPWYYLPTYLLYTLPLVVIVGLLLSIILLFASQHPQKKYVIFLFFSVVFPALFVIYEKSNLYGAWRHFLFIYPIMLVLASTALVGLMNMLTRFWQKSILSILLICLLTDPALFMIRNHPFYYVYYNPLIGGLKGAYTRYETDYYYHSLRAASDWIKSSILTKNPDQKINLAGNFPIAWYFRDSPNVTTSFCQYDQRSCSDWDYYLAVNSYIPIEHLRQKSFPPSGTVHTIDVDGVPICAIVKRGDKTDLMAYKELKAGNYDKAMVLFESALQTNVQDELIFFNFADVLVKKGELGKAETVLLQAERVNPCYEPVQMYLGNILAIQNREDEAMGHYENAIKCNRKYFEAYIPLSKLMAKKKNRDEAITVLKTCIRLNPGYKKAYLTLAEIYQDSDPILAKKYKQHANSIQ